MRLVWARHPPGPRTARGEFDLKTERPVAVKPDPVLPGVHRHHGGDFIAARAAGKKGATTPSPSATDSTRVDAAGGSAWHHVRHIPMPLRHEVLRLSYAVSFGIRLRCPFSSRLIQDQGSATSGRSPSSDPSRSAFTGPSSSTRRCNSGSGGRGPACRCSSRTTIDRPARSCDA